jgi:chromosome segregation protein
MYLKSLELHGFKSFPNKTVLSFERGATVIVGPNGSGKSNISDAMRWVLGELSSRNIRGTKMEDVIFGGTDSRRPMGFAEVSVTFDNSDPENRLDSEFDEVVITRRYYRTGESEYLINRQPKRLRDIYELFMNTGVGREGYSIIGQGKVAEIVSKKSDERRNIFEEAAGISKYRHRKEESERKLKSTQDNLDRVRDILTELENRVVPLEKEAEKARKGLALYEEKKRADVSLWLYDTKKIRVDVDEAEKALKLLKHQLGQVFALPKMYTFLNYLRCHDDIGWGLDYDFLSHYGQREVPHKRFLNDYFCGWQPGSPSRGELYNDDPRLGDARLCGTTASLCGIEAARYERDDAKLEWALRQDLMLHAYMFTLSGIPVLYSGDDVAQENDYG